MSTSPDMNKTQPEELESSKVTVPLFPPSLPLATIATILLVSLNRRGKYLPGAVFGDPQWLMTLDLFIASEERRDISVSSLCMASGVPPTTALRHIRYLESQGIFERASHPNDKRISHLRLSDRARRQVARYLTAISSGSLQLDELPRPLRAAH